MKSVSGNLIHGKEFRRFVGSNLFQCVLLVAGSLWLVHPYFSPRLIGAGDALWYHNLLADAIIQFREGVFPVFVGQSEFMFNGAVYPHRVAPYHQYFGGFLDILTGRRLGFFALQHLTIILSFVGGALAAYFALVRICPIASWRAAALSFLYVACPGVAGLAYAQDLYMSVMTLPWVPLALGGAWLTFKKFDKTACWMLAAGLAGLWWSHAPIAMWVTFLVAIQQLALIAMNRYDRTAVRAMIACAFASGLMSVYPFVSAILLRESGESVVPYRMNRDLLLQEIRNVFPACLLPIDPAASRLSQLQLGYALGAIAAVAAMGSLLFRQSAALLSSLLVFLLMLSVLPVPAVTEVLWRSLPESVVGLSLYWPMQRLYLQIAFLSIVGLQTLTPQFKTRPKVDRCISMLLFAGCLWSAAEILKFQESASAQSAANADSRKWSLTENATPQRHAYHLFPKQPSTMSHGVMDPEQETRLLDPDTLSPINPPANVGNWQLFKGTPDSNPGILDLAPVLTLLPGEKYRLEFEFKDLDYKGVLQIVGPDFFREYSLPRSGNERAFGSTGGAARVITLWTSRSQPTNVALRFIPTAAGVRVSDYSAFARFKISELNAQRQIRLVSLIPYRVTVSSVEPAVLESPRIAVNGYIANVNGVARSVVTTPEGFVGVPIGPGESEIEIRYSGPPTLILAFWISVGAMIVAPTAFGYFFKLIDQGSSP